ncbi:hypothetical protein B0H10DRAFT_1940640 [Mycena sp. CBHHK59/15]|nr:hypothetical protein B0H10DRAFT_1940640 [Mycena sp. CBHHK59/15]
MFVNERQKKHPQYSGIPFQPFGTVGGLIHWKILLVCELNITDVEAREHKAENVLKSRMVEMLKEIGSRVKQVWVNNKRPECNNDGICLTLALEWMVELVDGGEKGLGIQRNRDGEVIAVKEFRMIDM